MRKSDGWETKLLISKAYTESFEYLEMLSMLLDVTTLHGGIDFNWMFA